MKQPISRAAQGRRRPSPTKALAAASLCLACMAAGAAPLDDMRRQVEASQFEQAWATALANPQLIGDVHFDFLYGVAAINVGRVPEGLLALERHLSAVPANDRARLELARGYFLLGEYTRARAEFEFVLRYNPPAGVRANINGFLQAMQTRESADRRATARVYAEVGLGYDNNVNGGTYLDEIVLPLVTINTPGTPSKQAADGFSQVAVGAQHLARVTNRLSVFLGGDLDHRANNSERSFDISNVGLYAGFSQLGAGALWRFTLSGSQLQVGHNPFRDTLQLSTEANVSLTPEIAFTGFVQYAEYRHADADEQRDARATTAGAMLTRGFADLPGAPSLGMRLSWTQEQNQRLRFDLSKDTALMRIFAAVTPTAALRVSAGLTAYRQTYGKEDIVFASERKDDSLGVDLMANYAIDARWSMRADAAWTRIRSNQDLYDSSRKSVSLKLRYQY